MMPEHPKVSSSHPPQTQSLTQHVAGTPQTQRYPMKHPTRHPCSTAVCLGRGEKRDEHNIGVEQQTDQNLQKRKEKRGGLADFPGRWVLVLLSIPSLALVPPSILPGYHCSTGACPSRGLSTKMGVKLQIDQIL